MDANLLTLLLFPIVALLGGLQNALGANRRVRQERSQFRMAIVPETIENPRYWLLGLLPGLAVSVLLVLGRVTLTPQLVIFIGVCGLLLAMLPAFLPVLLGSVGLLAVVIPTSVTAGIFKQVSTGMQWAPHFALLVGIILIGVGASETLLPRNSSPQLFKQHGRSWVQYRLQQRLFVPLIVPLPVNFVHEYAWWPHLTLFGTPIALTLLPLILGLGMRHRQPEPQRLLRRDAIVVSLIGISTLIIGVLGQTTQLAPTMVLILSAEVSLFGACICLIARNERPAVASAAGGVRIVAVLANTPAEKMQLHRGDTVLQCNGQDVPTNAALYAATQNLGTFCRLRVRGFDGQIRLAETAIFAGTPHMLGIITFPEGE